MPDPIRLWGAGTSRTLRPIWVAEELGVPYELAPIGPRTGETRTEQYTRLNPKQKIPVMVDGDFRLSESVAICRYLIENYPGDAIYRPDTARDRAREDEWCCYIYGELDETSLYVMRRHGDLKHLYGEAPAAVSSAREYAQKHLGVVDGQLADRDHVMAGGFGLADILLTTCLAWARAYGVDLPAGLDAYRRRIGEREGYRRAVAVNFKSGG
ncbi:MAG: glutathione S-transferase family protein [Pseudomonadales bacterium]